MNNENGKNVSKLVPKWPGKPMQLFQAIDIDKVEFVLIGYKYKGDTGVEVTWTTMANKNLAHLVLCINNDVNKNMFS